MRTIATLVGLFVLCSVFAIGAEVSAEKSEVQAKELIKEEILLERRMELKQQIADLQNELEDTEVELFEEKSESTVKQQIVRDLLIEAQKLLAKENCQKGFSTMAAFDTTKVINSDPEVLAKSYRWIKFRLISQLEKGGGCGMIARNKLHCFLVRLCG